MYMATDKNGVTP